MWCLILSSNMMPPIAPKEKNCATSKKKHPHASVFRHMTSMEFLPFRNWQSYSKSLRQPSANISPNGKTNTSALSRDGEPFMIWDQPSRTRKSSLINSSSSRKLFSRRPWKHTIQSWLLNDILQHSNKYFYVNRKG